MHVRPQYLTKSDSVTDGNKPTAVQVYIIYSLLAKISCVGINLDLYMYKPSIDVYFDFENKL